MSTLHVIRHAQASMFAANYDELSTRGREQARILGEVLGLRLRAAERPGYDVVVCGPAQRHLDTAALAGAGLRAAGRSFPAPEVVAGFDEHDGQALVMAALAQLAQREGGLAAHAELARLAAEAANTALDPLQRSRSWQRLFEAVMASWLRAELELEGVETWASFEARVSASFDELRARHRGEVALFTSVGPSAVILARVLELPPAKAFAQAWRLYNASITRVVYSKARMTLDGFNEVAHLPLALWTHR